MKTLRHAAIAVAVGSLVTASTANALDVASTASKSVPRSAVQQASVSSGTPIILTEQASDQIIVMDSTRSWDSPNAQLWSWSPGPGSGVSNPGDSWGLPDDARLRSDDTGQQYILVTDSYGLLAKVPYPQGGEVDWSVELGHGPNPHGIELLPNDNIAVAASTGDFVRVYAASQGQHADDYAEVALPGAHNVLWDDPNDVLWAVGDHLLVKYSITGTDASPQINELASFELKTNWGHDLQPVSGDPDRLWVTTSYGVHQFVKSTEKFDTAFPNVDELYRNNVKSIGTDIASGTILQTKPNAGNPCSWCTDSVDLYTFTGSCTASKTLPDAQIYRARWFDEASN
jgi:hypothetical protein